MAKVDEEEFEWNQEPHAVFTEIDRNPPKGSAIAESRVCIQPPSLACAACMCSSYIHRLRRLSVEEGRKGFATKLRHERANSLR